MLAVVKKNQTGQAESATVAAKARAAGLEMPRARRPRVNHAMNASSARTQATR